MFRSFLSLTLVLVLQSALCAQDQAKPTGPERWESTIQALEALDKKESHPDDAILFVGSSSIRLWKTIEEDMAPYPAIRRGYGGAKFSDLRVYAKRLTHPHKCRAIVIFVANDVSGRDTDRTPTAVADDVRSVIASIRETHPTTPILFIAVTPTASRWAAWNKTQAVNAAIAEICSDLPHVHWIATVGAFLGKDGRPQDGYFIGDKLHLNEQGYDVWAKLIKARLEQVVGVAKR